MTSKAKQKGNSWELALCKLLSEVFNGSSFTRVPTSGAFTGGKNSFRKEILTTNQQKLFKGDIIPPDFMEKLVIECKSYSDFNFHLLLRDKNSQLDSWIEQTIISANEGDLWLVCIKLNNKGSFVVFSDSYMDVFKVENHFRYKTFVLTDLKMFLEMNKEKIMDIVK